MAKKKSKRKGNGVIGKGKPMVKILFDGLTHAGKVYKSGNDVTILPIFYR